MELVSRRGIAILGVLLVGLAGGCRNILGIDEDRPLLTDDGGGGSGASGDLTTTTTTSQGGGGGASTSSGDPEWPRWPLTPDGAPTSNYTLDAETVTDKTTGLMWVRTAPESSQRFAEASAGCEALELAGFDDWRLPTRMELLTLVTYEFDIVAINTDVFIGFQVELYWTSSPYRRAGATGQRWTIQFASGSPSHEDEVNSARALCVRVDS